jgi:hypothetical protein
MLFSRCLAIVTATTRRGLIAQAKYLALQFNDFEGSGVACKHMPDLINGMPWPSVFLKRLAKQLRRMGPELTPAKPLRIDEVTPQGETSGSLDRYREIGSALGGLEAKGMVPQAVRCLQALLTMKPSSGLAIVKSQRRTGAIVSTPSTAELRAKIDRLDEGDRRYMDGYMLGLIDGRGLTA